MERRELFKIITVGAMAGPAAAQQRKPFFTAEESATVDRLADIIIPADEQSPGAHDAGVIRYIDLLAGAAPPQRQQMWRRGIAAVESAARARFSRAFGECTRAQQEQIVTAMAAHEGAPTSDLERFFELVKHATIDGYRFSEIGVKQYMGWTGNHMDTKTWAGACTHPEHKKV